MNFHDQKQAAFAILEASGLHRSSYAPWGYRLMWMLGLNVPPPHFAGFAVNAVMISAWFVITVAVIRTLFDALMAWLGGPAFMLETVAHWWLAFLPFGIFFGPLLAAHFAWSARKHKLPKWSEIATASQ